MGRTLKERGPKDGENFERKKAKISGECLLKTRENRMSSYLGEAFDFRFSLGFDSRFQYSSPFR